MLVRLNEEYAPGLPITESGAPYNDYVDPNGEVKDPERIEYLRQHFEAAHQAIAAGVDLRGYFVWSLLDNLEWDSGYAMRFGLIFVEYGSQRQIPKSSAYWYSDAIRANGIIAETDTIAAAG